MIAFYLTREHSRISSFHDGCSWRSLSGHPFRRFYCVTLVTSGAKKCEQRRRTVAASRLPMKSA